MWNNRLAPIAALVFLATPMSAGAEPPPPSHDAVTPATEKSIEPTAATPIVLAPASDKTPGRDAAAPVDVTRGATPTPADWRAAFAAAFDTPSITRDMDTQTYGAMRQHYAGSGQPIWFDGLKAKATREAVVVLLRQAGDFGLRADDYVVPSMPVVATADNLAINDIRLTASALRYAHDAERGRTATPPAEMLARLAASAEPDRLLRGLHKSDGGEMAQTNADADVSADSAADSNANVTVQAGAPADAERDVAAADAVEESAEATRHIPTVGNAGGIAPEDWRTAFADAFEDKTLTADIDSAAFDALRQHYASASLPMWHDGLEPSKRHGAVVAELRKAADWGLEPTDYDIPSPSANATIQTVASNDIRLTLTVLDYVRHAEGGRVQPLSISQLLDVQPELTPPAKVIAALSSGANPDEVMRGYHPQHAGFKALQAALYKLRHPDGSEDKEEVDEALLVRLPPGKILRKGTDDPDVALLRKRLKVPTEDGVSDTAFDEALEIAVMAFQEGQGVRSDGIVGRNTRAALNGELVRDERNAERDAERIIVNMERWRWLPKDLGDTYVLNNVPEYMASVVHNGERVFHERIIVGLPNWPTPMMADKIDHMVFRPSWGMPDGIKMKELLPRLRRASGSNDFFSQLFGGGSSSGGSRVLRAYGLEPSLNGRRIDPDKVNWNNVDIRRYTFIQPPGAKNPLGDVKFMFPNKHDVYMHDTTQRSLFNQSRRALSHGCIRVQNPDRLAEVLLEIDQDMSASAVEAKFNSGGTVHLKTPIPVYLAYFTATADDDGKLKTFSDIYGQDSRVYAALTGKRMRYAPASVDYDEPPVASIETSSTSGTPRKKKSTSVSQRPSGNTSGDLISNALSGILNN